MPHEHFSFIIIGQKRNLRSLVSFHSPCKHASHLHYFPMGNGPCLLEQVVTKLPRFVRLGKNRTLRFCFCLSHRNRRKVFLHLGRQKNSDFTLFAPSISYIGFPSTFLLLLRPYINRTIAWTCDYRP